MAGLDAFGIALKRGDGLTPTETFTTIANVNSVKGPEISREAYDVTAHDSPNGWREFIGGLKDGGEVSVDVNYDPRIHDPLISDFDDPTPRNYRMVFPGTLGSWQFTALLTGFSQESPVDDKLAASLTLKMSGKPTITAGV